MRTGKKILKLPSTKAGRTTGKAAVKTKPGRSPGHIKRRLFISRKAMNLEKDSLKTTREGP